MQRELLRGCTEKRGRSTRRVTTGEAIYLPTNLFSSRSCSLTCHTTALTLSVETPAAALLATPAAPTPPPHPVAAVVSHEVRSKCAGFGGGTGRRGRGRCGGRWLVVVSVGDVVIGSRKTTPSCLACQDSQSQIPSSCSAAETPPASHSATISTPPESAGSSLAARRAALVPGLQHLRR